MSVGPLQILVANGMKAFSILLSGGLCDARTLVRPTDLQQLLADPTSTPQAGLGAMDPWNSLHHSTAQEILSHE